ncbi:hypothetical protein QR680_017990 [Steinernema hermaphroditum]|uniref:Saposin B-type domain-containing protein n=1 Tax=Steinernema hermaphroditum TaxID=289476 RepID=A0AA39HIX6_9BILA|nr:hypothetical protein QR680_017990 [Steinernema hermaphroditum]
MKLLFALLVVVGFVATTQAGFLCKPCEKVVGFLEEEFQQNGGVITQDAQKVCSVITLKNKLADNICIAIVDGQLTTIEKLLKEGKDAAHICKDIHFC